MGVTVSKSARRISADGAAALVRSGDWIDQGAALAQPDTLAKALAQRIGGLRNVSSRGTGATARQTQGEAKKPDSDLMFYYRDADSSRPLRDSTSEMYLIRYIYV